jgi:hypothetical protein
MMEFLELLWRWLSGELRPVPVVVRGGHRRKRGA